MTIVKHEIPECVPCNEWDGPPLGARGVKFGIRDGKILIGLYAHGADETVFGYVLALPRHGEEMIAALSEAIVLIKAGHIDLLPHQSDLTTKN